MTAGITNGGCGAFVVANQSHMLTPDCTAMPSMNAHVCRGEGVSPARRLVRMGKHKFKHALTQARAHNQLSMLTLDCTAHANAHAHIHLQAMLSHASMSAPLLNYDVFFELTSHLFYA